ncbi:hypothetical protein, partial [Vibrio parahaemolyticus]|uniref:hypothetical protein n=1 Tax=Vibrio parahaemolyticus TaxID=670 RepID=UPI0032AF8F65
VLDLSAWTQNWSPFIALGSISVFISRGIRFLMSHTLLGVTEFNGSFSGKQKGMRDASLCYFCLIKSEIKL